jgi:hypothetical protein
MYLLMEAVTCFKFTLNLCSWRGTTLIFAKSSKKEPSLDFEVGTCNFPLLHLQHVKPDSSKREDRL